MAPGSVAVLRSPRRAPQLVFQDDPVAQLEIAQVQLDDQIAARSDPGGKREVAFALADLLVGDFDPAPIAQDRLHGEDRDLGEVRAQRLPRGKSRNDEYGKGDFSDGTSFVGRSKTHVD
jgi:hypothetical protein